MSAMGGCLHGPNVCGQCTERRWAQALAAQQRPMTVEEKTRLLQMLMHRAQREPTMEESLNAWEGGVWQGEPTMEPPRPTRWQRIKAWFRRQR
jgi:hypothetical protein